jgi:hypothetical protein
VDDRQHPIDDLTGVVSQLDQDLASIGWMGVALHKTSTFESVEQRRHAGTAHKQLIGDDMPSERLTRSLEDCERLEGTWR